MAVELIGKVVAVVCVVLSVVYLLAAIRQYNKTLR